MRVEVYPEKEVVVDFDPELTFECVDDCTWCCQHGVLLYEPDFFGLAERADLNEATTQFKGHDFVKREPKDREEHVADDGQACFFLDENGLCELHAEHDWKPARCSVFPLEVGVEADGFHVSVREEAHEHCEGLGVSEHKVIDHLDAFLPERLWALPDPTTKVEL